MTNVKLKDHKNGRVKQHVLNSKHEKHALTANILSNTHHY